jgi:DNA (cytosine-5)-methyltransferase 1
MLSSELDVLDVADDIDMDSLGFDDDELGSLLDDLDGDDGVDELDEPELEDKALEDIDILNLYAGIGGNRFLWGNKPDVTAVEYNEKIAAIYEDLHPDDTVVVGDAHEYLRNHFEEFDFIWTSPPCPTHSHIRNVAGVGSGDTEPVYPDMKLYEEIIFLQNVYRSSGPEFDGKYIVENVTSYYDPLVEPIEFDRHYIWTNFDLEAADVEKGENIHGNDPERVEEWLGIDLSGHDFPEDYGRKKILNNVVHPKMGKSILESAIDTEL